MGKKKELNRNVKGQTLKWTARMNEQLSSCLWLLVHCSFVHCLHYVLWYNRFSFPARSLASLDSASALPTVMLFAVAHPLMSKFLIRALPRLSALCCFECLSCPLPCPCGLSVFPSDGCDVNIGLLLPWPTMHLQNPSLSLSPLTIMTGCCDDDFLLSCASTSCLLRLWHPTLPHVPYQLATACPCAVYGWLCFGERCSSPKFGLLADRYHFCEKCFNEIQGESVSLGDDPTQPQTWVSAYFIFFKSWFKNVQPFMQLNWRSRIHVFNCCTSGFSNFQWLSYNSLELF